MRKSVFLIAYIALISTTAVEAQETRRWNNLYLKSAPYGRNAPVLEGEQNFTEARIEYPARGGIGLRIGCVGTAPFGDPQNHNYFSIAKGSTFPRTNIQFKMSFASHADFVTSYFDYIGDEFAGPLPDDLLAAMLSEDTIRIEEETEPFSFEYSLAGLASALEHVECQKTIGTPHWDIQYLKYQGGTRPMQVSSEEGTYSTAYIRYPDPIDGKEEIGLYVGCFGDPAFEDSKNSYYLGLANGAPFLGSNFEADAKIDSVDVIPTGTFGYARGEYTTRITADFLSHILQGDIVRIEENSDRFNFDFSLSGLAGIVDQIQCRQLPS